MFKAKFKLNITLDAAAIRWNLQFLTITAEGGGILSLTEMLKTELDASEAHSSTTNFP